MGPKLPTFCDSDHTAYRRPPRSVWDNLDFHKQFKATAVLTDREINTLGIASAHNALGERMGSTCSHRRPL